MDKRIKWICLILFCGVFLCTAALAAGDQKDKKKKIGSDTQYTMKDKKKSDRKKQEGLDKVAPSLKKGEKAAGVLDKLSQKIGKLVDKVMPAPGAKEMGKAAGKTAKVGAKKAKEWRTRGDAVVSDSGELKIWNEKTGKWEDF
ncbi:MAG: hypothetical protein HUN04_21665 [Desulfobacter sp.]|nr:MAG: hypothetical protein HUN04_21665 [Desulfobacter sp.]